MQCNARAAPYNGAQFGKTSDTPTATQCCDVQRHASRHCAMLCGAMPRDATRYPLVMPRQVIPAQRAAMQWCAPAPMHWRITPAALLIERLLTSTPLG
eukprot:6529506-Pyramimonas_sp.AAC.1